MSITRKELNKNNRQVTPEIETNLNTLLQCLNIIREAYGLPMTVTSGLRSAEDQARINPGASKSRHLLGAAADIFDPKGTLQKWCLKNETLLEQVGLWCEAFEHTPTWVHFQTLPPKSGKRFFQP